MTERIDSILKHALTPAEEPEPRLNQNILNQTKEKTEMKHGKTRRRFPTAAAIAIAALCLSSATVYAVMEYLVPADVAKEVRDESLVQAFRDEDCILINETQSSADYKVTLLGIVSGEQLSQGAFTANGTIRTDRSHIVVAIENADGTPMPDTSQDAYGNLAFYVSPYIKGCDPVSYNAHTMHSYYADVVENGILYRLLECDNVELFADRGLYLGVLDSTFYRADAYLYNDDTGEITPNPAYEGMNLLFSLPLDKSKVDPEAAENYLNSLTDLPAETAKESTDTDESAAIDAFMTQLTPENINDRAIRVESTVQVLTPDTDGYINIAPYEIEGRGGSEGSKILASWAFPEEAPGMIDRFAYCHSKTFDTLRIDTFTKNADGTFTFAVYIPREE